MKQPNNYENTQAAGSFEPIALGGHKMIIKQVVERTTKNGDPMIVVLLDTDRSDSQPNYFSKMFADDIRPDKKWPNAGTVYITTEYNGECTRNFKGFCTAAEKSTPGFKITWGDGFCKCLKNKPIGGIYRTEIGWYNGKETNQNKLAWFCEIDKAKDAEIPKPYETKDYKANAGKGGASGSVMSKAVPSADGDGFMNIPDGIDDDEIPFN